MKHIVLLGDSIFDNGAYVAGGPDVGEQLQARLPHGWRATLLALDGGVTHDVRQQLRRMPPDATHLVVSAGGNDALGNVDILTQSARSTAEVLGRLADIADEFQQSYHYMLHDVLERGLPTAVCAIYYPRFPEPELQRVAVAALTLFNDAILREAFQAGVPLLDLRLICNEDEDYANPIEPSVHGGEKIAGTIHRVVEEHDFSRKRTEVFV